MDRDSLVRAKENAAKHSEKKYGRARFLEQISLLGNIANTVLFQTSNKASFNGRESYCPGEVYNAIGVWFGIDGTSMEEGN